MRSTRVAMTHRFAAGAPRSRRSSRSSAAVVGLALALPLILCRPAAAAEFLLYGPRAISLGGAYTALAAGPDALSWNPAGLSYPARLGAGYSRGGFTDDSQEMEPILDELRRVSPADPFYWGNPGRSEALAQRFSDLGDRAARDFRQTSIALTGDKMALGYSDIEHWVLNSVPDEERILARPPEDPLSIAGNQTAVDAYRLHLERYTVALSFLTPQDPFTVGFALHHHRGGVRHLRTRVFDLLSEDPAKLMRLTEVAPIRDNTEWSFDLGLLVPLQRLRLGVVARNLLFNKFPVAEPPEGALQELGPGPQLRIGVAWVAAKNQVAAMDLDLTNDRMLGGRRKTRSIALGYEHWMTGWLALRSGTSYELADDRELIFAVGTAVRLSILSLEAGGRINREGGFEEVVGGASVSF